VRSPQLSTKTPDGCLDRAHERERTAPARASRADLQQCSVAVEFCMWYTYIMAPRVDRLQELDDLLSNLRVAVQRPKYRRELFRGLDFQGGVAAVRLLRAVDILSEDNPPSVRDLATRLAVRHSTASRGVDTVVKQKLLIKRTSSEDHRRLRLELTDEGNQLMGELSQRRRRLLSQVTAGWDGDKLDTLVELLADLSAGFDLFERSA
jgi:DNA-binding MarR family transcriptional regulator